MKKIALWLFLCLFPLMAVGGTTLDDHIEKHCKTKCVDSTIVLDAATTAADSFDIDFKLILAIITVESGFVVKAKNRGNVGLMQVLLRYHGKKFKRSVYNPKENVRVGSSILKECMRKGRSTSQVLQCYNGVPGTKYANKVLVAYNEVKRVVF